METRSKRRRERMRRFNLDTMPDVAMGKIMEHCDLADIQFLRRSCTRLRDVVDLLKPDSKIKSIYCSINTTCCTGISMKLSLLDSRYADVWYADEDGGCVVINENKSSDVKIRRFYENKTFADVFREHFKILKLSITGQPIEFEVHLRTGGGDMSLFHETLGACLEERPLLRVKLLKLSSKSPLVLPTVLPLVSPDGLEAVELSTHHTLSAPGSLDSAAIVESEQWRRIRSLEVRNIVVSDPLRLLHIPSLNFELRSITARQLIRIKQAFQASPTFERCLIHLQTETVERISRALKNMVPNASEAPKDGWHFRCVQPETLLRVHRKSNWICFTLRPFEHVSPEVIALARD